MTSDLQILQLLRLVSPALPVGAFAYSQGLEGGVEQGWIENERDSYNWVSGVLENSIKGLDLPALYWQMCLLKKPSAAGDCLQDFVEFNNTIFAYRETAEFRLESHQMGQALLRLLRDTNDHLEYETIITDLLFNTQFKHIDWVSAFAIAASSVNITEKQAMLGYAWAWCETQVAAAIKLVPLGQTQGQNMLIELTNVISDVVKTLLENMPEKNQIGAISPNLAIISSLHETQYSRLFRS